MENGLQGELMAEEFAGTPYSTSNPKRRTQTLNGIAGDPYYTSNPKRHTLNPNPETRNPKP